MRRVRRIGWALFVLGAVILRAAEHPAAISSHATPPRLAVVISLDQFRADYLVRFRPLFVDGGFMRFLNDGAVFTECYHRHASTNTSNGHATIVTGVHANVHGIIGNDWLDRDTLVSGNSVADRSKPLVGAAPSPTRLPGAAGDTVGASPQRLRAATITDEVKRRWAADARVISVSIKDRAAVLMGGHSADGAYWFSRGRFITSRYYRDALPEWVEAFNREARAEKFFGQEWTRLLEAKSYDEVQGPDEAAGEETRLGLGGTFPHRIDGGQATISDKFYEAFRTTPFSNELVTEFAKAAVGAEELGRHKGTDMLCVSFSQTDYCGHAYGPDSHELMDSVLRLDRMLADLFAFLDREVGAGKYTVVLTSDHGVAPLPEHVRALQPDSTAGRFNAATFVRAVEAGLTAEFGAPPENAYWAVRDSNGFRFRTQTLQAKNVSAERAADVAKKTLLTLPQVASAFTREELLAAPAEGDTLIAQVRRSYNAERSQDVVFIFKRFVVDHSPAGTNHGTPYEYDRHVPLLWYGASVSRGVHDKLVGTDQLAPTLAGILGVACPADSHAEPLF